MIEHPVALVTGSASGFGRLTAIHLAHAGYYVLATMRNVEKSEALLSQAKEMDLQDRIEILLLDVTDQQSIQQAVERVQELERLDVLVNNAGFAMNGFVEEVALEEYKRQFETNIFGVIAITQQFLPIMRRQRSGKIINMSSISGLIGFPGLSPYVASKHALEGLSEALRIELKPYHIDVCLIEPGSYQTNIWTTGRVDANQSNRKDSPYYDLRERLESYINHGMPHYGNPAEVAQLVVRIAKENKPRLRYKVGKGTQLTYIVKKLLPWRLWEKLLLKQLKIK